MVGASNATWRVGVLFSRSGVSGITETEHFLGTALAIEEINTAGGVLGRAIEPVCYDPAGDMDAYRGLARRMLAEDGVEVVFGCSLSASRKAVLSTMERHNGLLWYPSIYEGFEYSENVVYTGATLNQNVFALADFLLQEYGPRIFMVGSDYIYPRESNRVMRDLIEAKGGTIVGELYAALDADDAAHAAMIAAIRDAAPDAVFSTVVGRGAERLYRAAFERNRIAEPWEDQPVGTVEDVAEKLAPLVALGYRHLIAGVPAVYDEESMTRLITEVKPLLEKV